MVNRQTKVFLFKPLIVYLLVAWLPLMICMILIISGSVTMSYHGIGVDSAGRVYVGTDDDIEVYENGSFVNSISPQTSRGYVFTLRDDDVILLSVGSKAFEISTDGEILAVYPDESTSIYNNIENTPYKLASGDGSVFSVRSIFGRLYVTDGGGETVYKTPALDYAVRVFVGLFLVSLFAFVGWYAHWMRKNRCNNEKAIRLFRFILDVAL